MWGRTALFAAGGLFPVVLLSLRKGWPTDLAYLGAALYFGGWLYKSRGQSLAWGAGGLLAWMFAVPLHLSRAEGTRPALAWVGLLFGGFLAGLVPHAVRDLGTASRLREADSLYQQAAKGDKDAASRGLDLMLELDRSGLDFSFYKRIFAMAQASGRFAEAAPVKAEMDRRLAGTARGKGPGALTVLQYSDAALLYLAVVMRDSGTAAMLAMASGTLDEWLDATRTVLKHGDEMSRLLGSLEGFLSEAEPSSLEPYAPLVESLKEQAAGFRPLLEGREEALATLDSLAPGKPFRPAGEAYLSGLQAQLKGDVPGALKGMGDAVRARPDFAEGYVAAAQLYLDSMGKASTAAAAAGKAVQLLGRPGASAVFKRPEELLLEARAVRGAAYLKQSGELGRPGRPDLRYLRAAEEDAEWVLQRSPRNERALATRMGAAVLREVEKKTRAAGK